MDLKNLCNRTFLHLGLSNMRDTSVEFLKSKYLSSSNKAGLIDKSILTYGIPISFVKFLTSSFVDQVMSNIIVTPLEISLQTKKKKGILIKYNIKGSYHKYKQNK